jgi:general secretion pathway protein M
VPGRREDLAEEERRKVMAGPFLQINARERKLLGTIGFVAAILLVLAVPVGLSLFIHAEQGDNDDLRQALADVQEARGRVRERRAKKDAIAQRYARKPPALAGYLEQTARQEKLEVTESVPLPDIPHGKRYMEHATNIHLKKTGMLPVAKFLEAIEQSGYPLAITRLNIRKRSGESDSFDVEVGVSSYDRSDVPVVPAAAASSKP